jgi:LuxR family transcriptional regulator, maltose regulon positive regulatory protein
VHAILTTRHNVRLGLRQLRLAGELAEIRAADLRLSERETRELLDASGIMLSEAGAALLYQRTEGWAAGLRLAAISLTGHPDPERFVTEFSGSERTVAEYLLAEMLDRQPPDVQDVLLRTSLLDRVNGELADLLTGRPGSERIRCPKKYPNCTGGPLSGLSGMARRYHRGRAERPAATCRRK